MNIVVREYKNDDLNRMTDIWNEVVKDGTAFPQLELLNEKTGREFLRTKPAVLSQRIVTAAKY